MKNKIEPISYWGRVPVDPKNCSHTVFSHTETWQGRQVTRSAHTCVDCGHTIGKETKTEEDPPFVVMSYLKSQEEIEYQKH